MVADPGRIGPCVGKVGKFICIGLNYADHAAETGAPIPTEPILFMKATSAIIGPNDDVVIPRNSEQDRLGSRARRRHRQGGAYVSEDEAMDHVAGYCVINDVSERDFQTERGGQWAKGKSCDTFGPHRPLARHHGRGRRPAGPEASGSRSTASAPGRLDQDDDLRRGAPRALLSQFMSLQPGDVISTGTPPGVGHGHEAGAACSSSPAR